MTSDGPDEKSNHGAVDDLDSREGLDNVPLENENGVFIKYEKGKFGVLDENKSEILPCIYDEVYRWKDCDVIQVRKGVQHLYYNMEGKTLLTKHRNGPVDNWLSPYSIGEQQNDVALMTMTFVDDCYDEQCCICYGRPTRFDRVLRQDIEGLMRTDCEYRKFPTDAFYRFNGWDTYIYRAYIALSKASNPMGDCVRQLHEMRCYTSSWLYIDKVWTNANTKLSDEELDLLQYAANDCVSGGKTVIGYGIDEKLKDGEVKIFHVEYFSDHWPSEEEWAEKPALGNLLNCLDPSDDWEETKAILEAHQELSSYGLIAEVADRLSLAEGKKEMQFCYKAIKWGLKHGWNPNEPAGRQTALEYVQAALSGFMVKENCPKYYVQITRKIQELLLKYCATTLLEYRKRNPFYRVEDFKEME